MNCKNDSCQGKVPERRLRYNAIFCSDQCRRLAGTNHRPMVLKNDDKRLAEFITRNSLHDFERDLASRILNNQKISLLQNFYWGRIKRKYSKY